MKDHGARPKALVTGATGFIGSHLVGHLERRGWTVGVLGRAESMSGVSFSDGVQRFEYAGETTQVVVAVSTFKPDVVFHLASLFLASHTVEQVAPLVASNVLFGAQVLEAMHGAGCKVLVNAGTGWQTFVQTPPYTQAEFAPVNLYAAMKQAFEDLALYYVQAAGLRMTTLRLFDSYGPGDARPKLLRLLLGAVRTGETLAMSPGDQVLDLVHVDDVCEAFIHAANLALEDKAAKANVYAVSGGQRRSLKEVVATLEEASGRTLHVEFGARAYRKREVMMPWDGPTLPGWKAKISLLEGFRQLVAVELRG